MEYKNLTISTNVSETLSCPSPSTTKVNSPSPLLTSSSSRVKTLETSPQFRRNKFRIEGHRGFGKHEPENTYQAFTSAIHHKLDGIELDVWLTSDKMPVIIHTSGGVISFDDGTKNLVYEMTFEEIRAKKILNNHVIPTLEEVLRLTQGKICVNIEFKGTDLSGAEIVLQAVKDQGMCEQVQFSSFNWKFYEVLNTAAKKLDIYTKIPFGFLVEEPELLDDQLFGGQAGDGITFLWDLLRTHRDLMLNTIERAKEKGYNVKVFFPYRTPENQEVYEELESLGIETVITNEPHLSKQYFANKTISGKSDEQREITLQLVEGSTTVGVQLIA